MEGSLVAYKVFTNGSVLNASEINDNLMNQSVAVFSNATARTAAITSPLEGQVTYLEDTGQLFIYNGSAWQVIATLSTNSYNFVQSVYFNSSGTFTKATYPWLKAIKVKCQGAGGGGSGGNGGTGDTTNSGGVGYTNVDKNGNPDGLYYSYGGGAGWSANGGSGGDILDGPYRPGNGGNGATSLYGAFAGGAGGRGYSLQAGAGAVGTNGLEWGGHGSGGQAVDGAGVRGVVYFRYYGE
jgi:hypothetical protein